MFTKIAFGFSNDYETKVVESIVDWLKPTICLNSNSLLIDVKTNLSAKPIGFSEISFNAEKRAWDLLTCKEFPDNVVGIENGIIFTEEQRSRDDSKDCFETCAYSISAIHLLYKLQSNINSYSNVKAWSSLIKSQKLPRSSKFIIEDYNKSDNLIYKLTNNLISNSDLLTDPIKLAFAQAFQRKRALKILVK